MSDQDKREVKWASVFNSAVLSAVHMHGPYPDAVRTFIALADEEVTAARANAHHCRTCGSRVACDDTVTEAALRDSRAGLIDALVVLRDENDRLRVEPKDGRERLNPNLRSGDISTVRDAVHAVVLAAMDARKTSWLVAWDAVEATRAEILRYLYAVGTDRNNANLDGDVPDWIADLLVTKARDAS